MTAADMRVLTIWQPWATLMTVPRPDGAPGRVKGIETRSWSTSYRGPVVLHAAARRADVVSVGGFSIYSASGDTDRMLGVGRRVVVDGQERWTSAEWTDLPYGAALAVADLVDVLPIVQFSTPAHLDLGILQPHIVWFREGDCYEASMYRPRPDRGGLLRQTVIDHELPYGDYTPGRYGWLFDNVRPLPSPVPWKGGQGLRRAGPGLVDACAAAGVLS